MNIHKEAALSHPFTYISRFYFLLRSERRQLYEDNGNDTPDGFHTQVIGRCMHPSLQVKRNNDFPSSYRVDYGVGFPLYPQLLPRGVSTKLILPHLSYIL
jgi:hypothetical protein